MDTQARIALIGLCMLVAPAVRADESCVTCHPDVKTEYAQSVHASELTCTGCHGGDPTIVGPEAHAVEKGYIGKPARKDIPTLCGTCHADADRMRPSGLPTDQLAQYWQSKHGQLLAQGDTRVAVCTDCHGTHRIVIRTEPTSPIYPQRVPATCGRCHADEKLMAIYNIPAVQLDAFRASVHGVALFVEQHPDAPTCATCHGAHGATALNGLAIGKVCGHCHTRTLDYFNDGPHGAAATAGQMSECISCHGYHDTPQPDASLFDTTCQRCHAPDSDAVATGQKLKTVLGAAHDALQTATTEITAMEPVAPTVTRLQPRLRQARAYWLEAVPVQHALALERVEDLTRSARSISEDVRAAVHGMQEDMRVRYIGLALAWAFILFAAAVTILYKRTRRPPAGDDGSRAP